jgi:hypothetical protein
VNLVLFLLFTAAPVPAPSACAVVTQAQVEAAVGNPVAAGVERTGPSHTACEFEGRNGAVTVELHQVAATVTLDQQTEALRQAFPDATFDKVKVGDTPGFAMHIPDTGTQIHLLRADRNYLLISVLGFRECQQAALGLARKVLAGGR